MNEDKKSDATTTDGPVSKKSVEGPTSKKSGAARPNAPQSRAPRPGPGAGAGAQSGAGTASDAERERILKGKREKRDAEKKEAERKLNMKPFLYTGPVSSITFGVGVEIQLSPDTVVEFPADHKYTKALLERGYLAPAPAEKVEA